MGIGTFQHIAFTALVVFFFFFFAMYNGVRGVPVGAEQYAHARRRIDRPAHRHPVSARELRLDRDRDAAGDALRVRGGGQHRGDRLDLGARPSGQGQRDGHELGRDVRRDVRAAVRVARRERRWRTSRRRGRAGNCEGFWMEGTMRTYHACSRRCRCCASRARLRFAADQVRVAVSSTSLFFASVYVAKQMRYFDENGLDVAIVDVGSGSNVIASVVGGSAEIGGAGIRNISQGVEKGQALKAFGSSLKGFPNFLVVRKASSSRPASRPTARWPRASPA